MVLVTPLQYYLHRDLKEVLDLCVTRHRKKWDNLLIIDGMERAGKTTLGKTCGHYYATQIEEEFGLGNKFFDPDKMIEYARTHRNKVIIWDEAALGGLSKQWQNKVQQKLVQMLMTCGKYGHFFIFIIPSFFELTWYLAVHRSIALIHVYSDDLESRGKFALFNIAQKRWIYNNNRKSETYTNPTFVGDFTIGNTVHIWNDEQYEREKDEALEDFFAGDGENQEDVKVQRLKKFAADRLKEKEACQLFKIDRTTYYRWKNLPVELDSLGITSHVARSERRSLRTGKNTPEDLPI